VPFKIPRCGYGGTKPKFISRNRTRVRKLAVGPRKPIEPPLKCSLNCGRQRPWSSTRVAVPGGAREIASELFSEKGMSRSAGDNLCHLFLVRLRCDPSHNFASVLLAKPRKLEVRSPLPRPADQTGASECHYGYRQVL
jgi:hypothetical protein